ncbi:hypothetical protein GCM10017673_08650 [Streptosporangium violaceochromogenes]|nr:hypothetical protein GCM10017673_08650 [Streptosporangium violaceochromogenes]
MSTGEHRPYTYLTALVDEGRARLVASFCTADLGVMVLGVGGRRPTLSFYSAEGEVKISTTGAGPVTTHDVLLAREIADAAARYRDECERLHTAGAIVPAPSPTQDDPA